jgi:ABC-2 type transport system permease protein
MMIKRYVAMLEIGWKQSLAYRADFLVGCISTLLRMVILSYIWTRVYQGAGGGLLNGRSLAETITYVIIGQAIWSFFDGNVEVLLGFKIRHGEIARDLLKPINFQTFVYLDHFGFSAAIFLIQTVPALIFACVFFPIRLPASFLHLILGIVSLLLAFTIYVSLSFTVGIIGFWTQNVWGLSLLKKLIVSTLSGNLIPLYFLPTVLRQWVEMLPFKEIIHTPILLYQGQLPLNVLGRQLLWALIFVTIGQLSWMYLKRKIEVLGG